MTGIRRLALLPYAALLSGCLAVQAAPPAESASDAAVRRPNIVVVIADDMRVDDLKYAPNVRRLMANTGLRFANSFTPNPECCPSRSSFFTGRYSHNHGVVTWRAPWGFGALDDSKTLPVFLHDAGYRTGFVGKYLNGYGSMRSRVTGGSSLHYVPRGWTDWYGAVEPPDGSDVHGNTYDYFDTPFNVNGRIDNTHRGEYQTDVIGRFSRDLATAYHRSGDPFFLYLSFVAPHFGGPREPDDTRWVPHAGGYVADVRTPARPEWVRGHFDSVISKAPGLPAIGSPEGDLSDKPAFLRSAPLNDADRTAVRNLTRQRAEAIFVLDQQVARLVAHLKALGEWQDTVLMFTSDNGYYLGEHRVRSGKTTAYEPSLRVPFLVTGPGIPQGVRFDPITTVDLFPTILDLAGIPARQWPGHDGMSRVAVMRDGDAGWSVPIVTEGRVAAERLAPVRRPAFHHGLTSSGLRTPRYSYIVYGNGSRELYDLAVDANQLHNVVDKPRYRFVVRRLQRLLNEYRNCRGATCRAPMPDSLRAPPLEERRLTRSFWRQVEERFAS